MSDDWALRGLIARVAGRRVETREARHRRQEFVWELAGRARPASAVLAEAAAWAATLPAR